MLNRKSFGVRRITAAEGTNDLPRLSSYQSIGKAIDVFIVAAGFEERSLAMSSKLSEEGARVRGRVLVGSYSTNHSDNSERYLQLRPILSSFGADIVEFPADDPTSTVSQVRLAIEEHGGPSPHVVFDVSGASSTLIINTLAAIFSTSTDVALTLLYAEAESYDCLDDAGRGALDPSSRRESGVSGDPVSGPFTGHHHDHLPSSVIALPSMYTGRLEACLAHLNVGPITGSEDNLFWILPTTTADQHKWRQDRTRSAVELLIRRLQGRDDFSGLDGGIRPDDMVVCDTLDYAETAKVIVSRIDALPGRNISIAHMGSKMQAVGVALAVSARSEAAVLTVRPASFNAKSYSAGIGRLHSLHFDSVRSTKSALASIGSLEVS